jgi:nucleoside-diphosphate-sugar epimerase
MKNVLVLGGNGYIGTRLRQVLAPTYNVSSVDIGWYDLDPDSHILDYHDLTEEELSGVDAVIVLAGHSSVKSCLGDVRSPWMNNVTNFTQLLDKLHPDVTVIYASSSSVYGNSLPGELHKEQVKNFVPINHYDLTKYTLDLHAHALIAEHRNIIGLRFGTVNGWSPVLRTDVMINAMYSNAVTKKEILVTNKGINRALLGLEDLCRAVVTIIEHPHPGIYNLSSFNTTVADIADVVSDRLDVPVIDQGDTPNVYDFALDCTLFEKTYGFTFTETPASIVDGLVKGYDRSRIGRRDDYINYEWNKTNG